MSRRRFVTYALCAFAVLLQLHCGKSDGGGSSYQLTFSMESPVATHTCTPFTVSLKNTAGETATATSDVTVTLSGLGRAAVYASRANCVAGTSGGTTVAVASGTSSITGYFRSATGGTFTVTASANRSEGASQSVKVNDFRVLGHPAVDSKTNIELGLSQPTKLFTDGTRLLVADRSNNRVLIWNSTPSDSTTYPSLALGQTNLANIQANGGGTASASTLNQPYDVYYDGTRLYVADHDNHRVLIWNRLPTASGTAADVVLGQPDFTTTSSGRSISKLNGPTGLYAVDGRLYVADSNNHRVMVWSVTATSGADAVLVLGQNNFNDGSNDMGTSKSKAGLFSPEGVFGSGTRLFVADRANHRVLMWDGLPTSNGESADYVLGQPDGGTTSSGTSTTKMNSPRGGAVHGTRVFVADTGNNRIVVFGSIPTGDNPTATQVLGQLDTTSSAGGCTSSVVDQPYGVSVSSAGIFVAATSNQRVLSWPEATSSTGAQATFVYGQSSFTSQGINAGQLPNSTRVLYPEGVWSDGTRLFVADASGNRVLVWNKIPIADGTTPDFALGQTSLTSVASNAGNVGNTPSAASLKYPIDVFTQGNKLFVADCDNNRVLIWDPIPTTMGESADVVVGQSGPTTNSGGGGAAQMRCPIGVYSDGQRLFVADADNHRVLVFDPIPTSDGASADFALGQTSWAGTSQNQGLGAPTRTTLHTPSRVRGTGSRVFVSDYNNRRVLVYDNPTDFAAPASMVVGQAGYTSSSSTASKSVTARPYGLFVDSLRLLVADYAANRALRFQPLPTTDGADATAVYGQTSFTATSPNQGTGTTGATTLAEPNDVFADDTRLFVADGDNNRILIMPLQ